MPKNARKYSLLPPRPKAMWGLNCLGAYDTSLTWATKFQSISERLAITPAVLKFF